MEFSVKKGSLDKQKTACVVVGVHEKNELTEAARVLDAASGGAITSLLADGDLKGKPGQTLWLHAPDGIAARRVLLVGCGKAGELDDAGYRKAVQGALGALKSSSAKDALFAVHEVAVKGRDTGWKARQVAELTGHALYRFDQLKSKKDEENGAALNKVMLSAADDARAVERGLAEGRAIAEGVRLAKDLGNLPGNICTPGYLADQAVAMARKFEKVMSVEVLDAKAMEKLGMGSLLSVARGSREPAKLIALQYHGGRKKEKPVVLVGKGLTFDAGGISLKPASGMDEMKYDMCGAAAVLGTLRAAAELGLARNIVGVIPATENLPGGAANKPGDVVTSLSGQTIEILNTDAEGRLILCDALTYSKRFDPAVVIDIATLTGACVVALGKHASGLLGNDDALVDALLAAGTKSGDRAWQLPLWPEYDEQLKSPFADMANIGGKEAGTVTAACFLARYTKEYTWAHLDIAGTAWNSGSDKGATGRPIPLLVQYLLDNG